MKKIFTAILIIAMLCSTMAPTCLAANNDECWEIIAEPASSENIVRNTTGIYNGIAYVQLYCKTNNSSVISITATSRIEKKVGNQWVVMPLENGDTEWTNTASGNSMNLSVEQRITTGAGMYCVTTTFAIYYIGIGTRYETATYETTY